MEDYLVATTRGYNRGICDHRKDTVRGYFVAYNAEDFARCLTYFTGFGDEQAAQASLSLMREFIGEMTLHEVGYMTISDQTATAEVGFTFWWDRESREMYLKKVNGDWKIAWGQEPSQQLHPDLAPAPSSSRKVHRYRHHRDSP